MATITKSIENQFMSIFFDPPSRVMFANGNAALNADAPWELTATILDGLFNRAFLSLLGFRSSNSATVPTAGVNDMMGAVIKRDGNEIWVFPPALIRSDFRGGGLSGQQAFLSEFMPPFPLYPGDNLLINGPTIDTNGAPAGDIVLYVGFTEVEV